MGFPHGEDLKKLFLKLDADGSGDVKLKGPMLRVFAFSWGDHMVLQFHYDISIVFLGLYPIELCANNSSIVLFLFTMLVHDLIQLVYQTYNF